MGTLLPFNFPSTPFAPKRGQPWSGWLSQDGEKPPRPRVTPNPSFCLLPASGYLNTTKELPNPLPPYLLLLEWLSTARLFFSTTLAEDFLFLPSPNSPSGPPRRPPPQWVAQNGERGAAQDGGSASLCSIRFRCLFSGRLLSLGEPKLEELFVLEERSKPLFYPRKSMNIFLTLGCSRR